MSCVPFGEHDLFLAIGPLTICKDALHCMCNIMNEITELYREQLSETNNETVAAILTLAEVINNKRVELDGDTAEFIVAAIEAAMNSNTR
jgi:hypothetical protein